MSLAADVVVIVVFAVVVVGVVVVVCCSGGGGWWWHLRSRVVMMVLEVTVATAVERDCMYVQRRRHAVRRQRRCREDHEESPQPHHSMTDVGAPVWLRAGHHHKRSVCGNV
jgi:hypothetical protein